MESLLFFACCVIVILGFFLIVAGKHIEALKKANTSLTLERDALNQGILELQSILKQHNK